MRLGADVRAVVVDDGRSAGAAPAPLVGFCDNICGRVFTGSTLFDLQIVRNVTKNKFRNARFNKMELKSKL